VENFRAHTLLRIAKKLSGEYVHDAIVKHFALSRQWLVAQGERVRTAIIK